MELLDGWWDDFAFGSLMVLRLFIVSLAMATLFGLVGAARLKSS